MTKTIERKKIVHKKALVVFSFQTVILPGDKKRRQMLIPHNTTLDDIDR